ncbi:hypothetical protein AIOL_002731 [Candidatus Rhodobacter oscarellae]|uniref:Uncharacterized protein n=1 Tax=Candidatus Rhodobacter oscarellae TaxID=1675527 RepID=A0A0J9GW24_9RHOB|nr:hypothetical protein [Candidatus Rhodobacter lobularis]KMW57763.1 hypothetical protein AIOL_002731 [Candidatus Rhodobacter lobularis]
MDHLEAYRARDVLALPLVAQDGWRIKQYAILSAERVLSRDVTDAAAKAMIERLPPPGGLDSADGNHGICIQIVHFAQVAVVAPAVYWQWGSVLARLDQMRAPWEEPTDFKAGVPEVLGCVWEMDVIAAEVALWRDTVLSHHGAPEERLKHYLSKMPGANA